jgi:hypothetical protein
MLYAAGCYTVTVEALRLHEHSAQSLRGYCVLYVPERICIAFRYPNARIVRSL